MEGVDHIHIVQIRRGGFVSQVDGMTQRQIPDGECFKFRVSGFYTPFVFMPDLTQAGGHFPAAGTGSRYDHQRTAGLNIIVFTETVFGKNEINIGRIIGNHIMKVNRQSEIFQLLFESCRGILPLIMGDHHTADKETAIAKSINEAQCIQIVSNAEITAVLIALNIVGADGDDDLRFILHAHQHTHFGIRLETGQHPAGMVIIEELAAEFKIKLSAEASDPFPDLFGLFIKIFIVIKPDFLHGKSPFVSNFT